MITVIDVHMHHGKGRYYFTLQESGGRVVLLEYSKDGSKRTAVEPLCDCEGNLITGSFQVGQAILAHKIAKRIATGHGVFSACITCEGRSGASLACWLRGCIGDSTTRVTTSTVPRWTITIR